MSEDELWKRFDEEQKQFRTQPFLGDGMHCYNVPVEKVRKLVSAFTTLFLAAPDIEVWEINLVSINGKEIHLTKPTPAIIVPTYLPYLEIMTEDTGAVLVVPQFGVWSKIELRVPPKKRAY